MSRRRKILIALAGCGAILLLFSAFVLPGIIRAKAVEAIAKATGRQTGIDKVSINPLTLRGTVTGFRMKEADGRGVFASFSSLSVRVSTASVVRRAIVIGEMSLVSPRVSLVRVGANRYNFSDIVDLSRKQPKSEGETHFSLNNIRIEGGTVDFDDRAARVPARHTIRSLSLAIPFISNIPYMADRYVTPHFAAVINDAPLRMEGKLKPLDKSLETSLTLKLDRLDLTRYLPYLPFEPGFAMPGGSLSTDLELAYRIGAKEKPDLNITGTLNLAGVSFTEKRGAPLVNLSRADARINRLSAFRGEADIASLKLDGLDIHLSRDKQGVWNYERLLPRSDTKTDKASPAKPEKADGTPLPPIKVTAFSIANSAFHFRDGLPGTGFATNLDKIAIEIKGFSTVANQMAQWSLGCVSDGREELSATGTLGAAPWGVSADISLAGVRLQRYHPYLADLLTAPVSGIAGLKTNLTYSEESGLRLADTSLTINGLLVPFGDSDKLRLKTFSASNATLNLKERQATVGNVAILQGSVAVTREADGTVSPQKLVKKSPAAPAAAPPLRTGAPKQPFRYTVQNVEIKGVDASFTDKGRQQAPTFTLKGITATARNVTGPRFAPIPFSVAARFGNDKARIMASGTAVPDPFTLKGQVTLTRIPLRDFDAYYPDDMGIFIAGGAVDARVNLDLAKKGEGIGGSYAGSIGVRSFHSLDTVESEDLLKWESMQIDNVRGTLAPFSLGIRDISLTSPFARVIVNRDGTLNLQNLRKAPDTGQPGQTVPQPAPAPPQQTAAPPVTIDTITIQNGTIDFIDRKLPGGFASTFFDLGGRVSGLSSEASRFATVDLRGALENRSPLKISGTINPLRGDLFMDLNVAFTDIELSPVTPYSGTYLGYSIDKGKLFLDLKYRIENKALEAQNKVFIDQFTFGRKMESEQATNLPVKLAVALLKDSKGEIHLDLPVTGRTDDPKFSVWKVVFQMLRNLLVKAATSPFSLLSSLLGSGEEFSSVTFAPGSAKLSPAEQEKLAKLAGALKERPAISLEMAGYVDRQRDPEGYRQELLGHKIRNEKFLSLVKARQNRPEDSPDTVSVSPEEYPVFLKAVYRKEEFPKPRNAIGMIKDLPEPEMKKLILAHLPVGDRELLQLARDRAAAVQTYLRDTAKFPPERLFLKQDDPDKSPEKKEQSRCRVDFGVVVK